MKKIVLAVIMLLPAIALAQSIKGKISQAGNAVPYIEVIAVKIRKNTPPFQTKKGNYSLKLSENGNYTIKLLQDGIEISNRDIVINGEVKQDFLLKKE